MTGRTERIDRRRCRRRMLASALVALATLAAQAATAAETLTVILDQARLVKLPDRVGTIVVGNPLIADVSIQAGGTLVVTGKGYGTTNLIALDRAGNVLMERAVEVRGPRENVVVVYRGIDRESYSCTPYCERRITLGDVPTYFDSTMAQTNTRNDKAGVGAQQSR